MSEVGYSIAQSLLKDEKDWFTDVQTRLDNVESTLNAAGELDSRLDTIENKQTSFDSTLNTYGVDAEAVRELYARTETFFLTESNNMRPVTFGDLKSKNISFDGLKYGFVRFYAFRFWRFEGSGTL